MWGEISVSTRPYVSALTLYWRSLNLARLKRTLCVVHLVILTFFGDCGMTPTILLLYCVFLFVWYFSQVIFFVSTKIVFTLELRSRWKLTEKESPACRVGILCSAYHSSSYTDRSSRLPVYHFINRLACLFFYDFSTVGLEPKWPIRVYILWKNHDKKRHAHNTHNDTQCSKKRG